jgi:hypothetical protein
MVQTAEKTHIDKLAGHIERYRSGKKAMMAEDSLDEMIQIIHRPGWTTVAEMALVTTMLDNLREQAASLATKEQALLAAMRLVAP